MRSWNSADLCLCYPRHGGTLYDVEGGVEADVVGQVQRPHGVPRAQLRPSINEHGDTSRWRKVRSGAMMGAMWVVGVHLHRHVDVRHRRVCPNRRRKEEEGAVP